MPDPPPSDVSEATPRPWKSIDTSVVAGLTCIAVLEDDGEYAAPADERRANAHLIVSAVNAYDGLLEVARAAKCGVYLVRTGPFHECADSEEAYLDHDEAVKAALEIYCGGSGWVRKCGDYWEANHERWLEIVCVPLKSVALSAPAVREALGGEGT
jgi:hypothetical protein